MTLFTCLQLDEETRLRFLLQAQKHFITACAHIIDKSALSSEVVKACRCLQPERRRKLSSDAEVETLARALPLEVDIDLLRDEWRSLRDKPDGITGGRIDTYWAQFFNLKTPLGDPLFPTVASVVKAALCLSHGNAQLERGFSDSGRFLTDDKSQTCERTLNAAMTVKSGMKKYLNKPQLVPSSKELLQLARHACSNYKAYLEEESRKNEEKARKDKAQREKEAEEKERKEKLAKDKETLTSEEKKLEELKKNQEAKRKIENKLFEEANKRLKSALEKQDLAGVEVANALLDGVSKAKRDLESQKKKVDSAEKVVDKKKNRLISEMFKKK